MKRKIVSILLIIITLITSIIFVGCGDKKETKPTEAPTIDPNTYKTEFASEPEKVISEENAVQSIKDYDINSNTIKYKETDLSFEITSPESKIIYNKNDVIVTFKSLQENSWDEVGQCINLTIENKSKDDLKFESDSIIVNDTIAMPCDLSESVPASGKIDTEVTIYPETLYENHIKNINNLSFLIKLDFNNYTKIREELPDWSVIKLSDYSDKIFRDVTKTIKIEMNSMKQFDEPKGETLFSNDIMDIIFEGFVDNQVKYSRSNNYQKGFFKVVNKSDEYLRIRIRDFVLNGDSSIDSGIISNGCFIPPNKTGYCFFEPNIGNNSLINELKKYNSLSFTFDISQDLTDEEVSSLDFIIGFKK